jgi:serine/threonine protein kinase/Tfp pilus assembly protein PilF
MIGKTISHYRIIEELGRGGMGVVYKAEDTRLKRTVALKFLPPELTRDPEAKARFIREAQAASSLDHPNICTIYEINETEDGRLFIVMACYEGQILKDVLTHTPHFPPRGRPKGGIPPLSIDQIISITTQIAQGLAKAHEEGIIHRDIKPANIFITKDGIVKILDFGLAKLAGQAQVTKDASTLGTVAYMSPGQLSGKEIDQRTDIWSLGVVMYEMLTGKLPFKGDYEQAVIYSILNDEPESALNIKSDLPVELNRIIKKALEKNPQQRYQNIDEIISDLNSLNLVIKSNYSIKEADKDKSKKIRKNMIIGPAVLILIIVVGIGYFLMNQFQKTTRVIDSLAVLPLENLSGDPDQEYFSDGMTEALITELSRIKALKVISRTSVMQFKNSRKSLPEIAGQLNVAAVVEGSILKAGDKVRITAQLIDAESDRHLWAESYERNLRDILTVQKEVAKAIALQIKTNLTPAEEDILNKETSIDPAAHEAYLKGNYFLNQVSVEGARKAIEYFDRIIEIEPKYAPAYTGKALAYNYIVSYNAIPPKQGWPLVKEWAEKALDIDKNNSDAILLMADVKFIYEWDWPGAEKAYQKSIELNPNNSRAYNWYATFLSSMGRNTEALSLSQKAIDLAPLSIAPYYNGIIIRVYAGLYEEAEVLMDKVKELYPNHPISPGIEGLLYLERGQYQQALPLFQSQLTKELSPGMKDLARARIAFVYAQLGDERKSRDMLKYLINRSRAQHVSPTRIALIYSALGEVDQAFAWLDRAYNERCDELPFLIKPSHLLDKLRPDLRFHDLMKRMKLD